MGGIQEETTIRGVPCVTLREDTERPVTITKGTNIIGGIRRDGIIGAVGRQLAVFGSNVERTKEREVPPLWDGKAAERIVNIVAKEI